jgi:hypothetical protein
MQAWKRGLWKETRGLPRHFKMIKKMPLLLAALDGCNFLMTLTIFALVIDMGEGISRGYEVLEMSERSASGLGGKNQAFIAFAF